ncbi:hypothetical protein OCU04_003147 [Sclerotinia nivalis]|uniref:Uncharacterized protein n=1 Tax=Sclerotinia nivalis TaxID=352851 RepID=A0A9X0AV34_9HELO|nr:hypothetical protein OCU04_003147 [Sclerotinia nivalis]
MKFNKGRQCWPVVWRVGTLAQMLWKVTQCSNARRLQSPLVYFVVEENSKSRIMDASGSQAAKVMLLKVIKIVASHFAKLQQVQPSAKNAGLV